MSRSRLKIEITTSPNIQFHSSSQQSLFHFTFSAFILVHDQLGFQQREGYTNPRNLTVQKIIQGSHEQGNPLKIIPKHEDKKITQKTNNAETQPENDEKRLKQVRKRNLRRISKKRRLTKQSQRTLRSRKRKSPQSKSHKIKRPLTSSNRTQSLLKRKLKKRKRINNLSQTILSNHSQKMVKMNKKRQLTQNKKPSQSQRTKKGFFKYSQRIR
ncbi:Hypothetical_protein [Hexamita inflata]|uniref:Hypothetical_protein n=1 Tax=Hexamita inflata TaxID=28002 RepID=A0AA86QKM4_9EUKA|nr:Hypothetical protein HINF_LOCUS9421 [Hexamita inflata]CAI9953450.1 Hypothetical protein HINF_LOCUS41095 [Hexamita inflata]